MFCLSNYHKIHKSEHQNTEDPLSTHFSKIRLKAQPGFTRVNPGSEVMDTLNPVT